LGTYGAYIFGVSRILCASFHLAISLLSFLSPVQWEAPRFAWKEKQRTNAVDPWYRIAVSIWPLDRIRQAQEAMVSL
jgi:hypothetical protein